MKKKKDEKKSIIDYTLQRKAGGWWGKKTRKDVRYLVIFELGKLLGRLVNFFSSTYCIVVDLRRWQLAAESNWFEMTPDIFKRLISPRGSRRGESLPIVSELKSRSRSKPFFFLHRFDGGWKSADYLNWKEAGKSRPTRELYCGTLDLIASLLTKIKYGTGNFTKGKGGEWLLHGVVIEHALRDY